MDAQMKSLDKKMHKGFESPQAVHSPRQCASPSDISHASTAHPTPSPEPEADEAEQPDELTGTLPSTHGDNIKISLSLSPEMLEQIGSGGQIRFALQLNPDGAAAMQDEQDEPETPATTLACDNGAKCAWECVSPVPEEEHTPSYSASSTSAAARVATQTEDVADEDDRLEGMTDEELIAMLAGCAAAPKFGTHDSRCADNAAAEQSMVLCIHDDSSVAEACAFSHLKEGCENTLDVLHGLVCESQADDDDHSRLWSEDLLGLC